MINRDIFDPKYLEWRQKVLHRDFYRCKQCGGKKRLYVHPIRCLNDHPELRYDVNNGITLCNAHHQYIQGKEDKFIPMFISLLTNYSLEIRHKLWKIKQEEEDDEED